MFCATWDGMKENRELERDLRNHVVECERNVISNVITRCLFIVFMS